MYHRYALEAPVFGQYIRKLRGEDRGVTEVARTIGVDRTAVHQWENGTKFPDPENLGKLLDLYGATDDERLEAWRLRSQPRERDELPPEKEQAAS